ncbi:MAG: hypothetical protein JWN52_1892 [Actinomycetia bacterium]|nr:hypothetical protein [Actinomycetes bacterium]
MEPLNREQLLALPLMTTIEMAARALCLGELPPGARPRHLS